METPPQPLFAFDRVGVAFGSQTVLRELSFAVPRGQTLAVIGESGCGKTVLLKLFIALLRPTVGKVLFEGKVLADLPDDQLLKQRLRMGFLFQGAALFDSLTVYDNVAFGMRSGRGADTKEMTERVRQRLQEVGLPAGVELKKPAELSGGMKKRVGLARALALDPEVMLYDEPTTGLDPIMSDVINELIVQARKRRPMTSIIVTHDMKTVHKAADRVLMLSPLGRLEAGECQVLFDGPPSQLEQAADVRVTQFVRGQAGERLRELAKT
jgi:phospholipid/cholesterol/gamma-HCH transport system ATP-binding protein